MTPTFQFPYVSSFRSGLIHPRHPFVVAIIEFGREGLPSVEHVFLGLAPARMRDMWVDVGLKVIFPGDESVPEGRGLLFGQLDADDRFRALVAVFPRDDQTDRSAML